MTFAAKVFLCLAATATAADATNISPVTRVVELLQALGKQVEKEGKVEEGLYSDFVCWSKSTIKESAAKIEEDKSKISEIDAYEAAYKAGRIELTSERTDLEKEISELMDEMETATAIRDKEHGDFEVAEEEMNMALDALASAIEVMEKATEAKPAKTPEKEELAVLLAVRGSLKDAAGNGGMAKFKEHQAKLSRAVNLGERFLEKADAMFLRRVLLGEVPKVDNKKLNRKATFKMSYKARSGKIQSVLQKMNATFSINLEEAQKKEEDSVDEYKSLFGSKQKQLNAARDSMDKRSSEDGEQERADKQNKAQRDILEARIEALQTLTEETQKNLEAKMVSWTARQDLRAKEAAAISKAIYILNNDDKRDLFKRSFASQAQFLQVGQTSHQKAGAHKKVQKAAASLKEAARLSGDKRLLALALSADKPLPTAGDFGSEFGDVVDRIEAMMRRLDREEQKDLSFKQKCEDDRQHQTRDAIVLSRDIDEYTDSITKLLSQEEECNKTIAAVQAEKKTVLAERLQAEVVRNRAHEDWVKTNKDDHDAYETVKDARDVLSTFYRENGLGANELSLAQKDVATRRAHSSDPAVPAVPPPATWDHEEDYQVKSGESMGIVAIMDMVMEDIKKDRLDAKADEDASKAEYKDFLDATTATLKSLKEELENTQEELGTAMTEKTEFNETRSDSKDSLNDLLGTIKAINPNCEYYEVNYPLRVKNRHIEYDGLTKAKLILTGSTFGSGPKREEKTVHDYRGYETRDPTEVRSFLQKK